MALFIVLVGIQSPVALFSRNLSLYYCRGGGRRVGLSSQPRGFAEPYCVPFEFPRVGMAILQVMDAMETCRQSMRRSDWCEIRKRRGRPEKRCLPLQGREKGRYNDKSTPISVGPTCL